MARSKSGAASTPAKAVDAQLEKYRSMRNFGVTAEPSGAKNKKGKSEGLPFVVQKHAATRLHYDFRLGWNGVLKSWAVAKGPSYVVADKRLAIEVEDHPIEYGGFEGTIPKGQYGGGTVMVWDTGTWVPQPGHDFNEGLAKGSLKFILHGKKLVGKWALIRMKPRPGETKPAWLLIKEHDEYERPASDEPITEAEPDSALTGRTMEEIGDASDHVWNSNRPEEPQRKTAKQDFRERLQAKFAPKSKKSTSASPAAKRAAGSASSGRETRTASKKKGTKASAKKSAKEPPPARRVGFLQPQLAVEADAPPSGDEWIHELKLDGYRIQAHVINGEAKLYTRSGLDWTARMPAIAKSLGQLQVADAVVDGEVVVIGDDGRPSFADLQASFQDKTNKPLTYYVFDLLEQDGRDLRNGTLLERKQALATLLAGADKNIRFTEHISGHGDKMFSEACRMGAEGIISKRGDSKYCAGRHSSWVKAKCVRRQEFVIGGWTPPTKGHRGLGALLLGYYKDGALEYAGRTGTGFTFKSADALVAKLKKIGSKDNPFRAIPRPAAKNATWVKPELVCEVAFATWTADNLVRQASFQGLREDKTAKDIRKEDRAPVRRVETAAEQEVRSSRAKEQPAAPQLPQVNVRLSNPDKILDPESGLTKRQLFEYILAAGEHILPHVADRPLTLVRCPDGTKGQCFYQKHMGKGMPAGIRPVDVTVKSGDKEEFLTLNNIEALAGLAQMGVMELHPWGSKNETLEQPDRLIFDLDPDTALPWKTVADAAEEVREKLRELKLESFVKSTGGKGLHIVAPIKPQLEWPAFKAFAHAFVLRMEHEKPKLYLTKMSKAARAGKIFLDYLRNERGATAVSAWSPRARPGVNVAVPLSWDELPKLKAAPKFRVVDFARWQERLATDPWLPMLKVTQQLRAEAVRALSSFSG